MPEQLCKAFILLAKRCGREHGVPLPKGLLLIGKPHSGWGASLNTTLEKIDDVEPCYAKLTWNGNTAGFICAFGGIISAGEESSLIEWLKSDIAAEPSQVNQ